MLLRRRKSIQKLCDLANLAIFCFGKQDVLNIITVAPSTGRMDIEPDYAGLFVADFVVDVDLHVSAIVNLIENCIVKCSDGGLAYVWPGYVGW